MTRATRRPGAHQHDEDDVFEPHMNGLAEWFPERSAEASLTENAPRATPRRSPTAKRSTKSPSSKRSTR